MTAPEYQARRATLDDLPALRPLWDAERLDANALEKRLTEFQVVCDASGTVIAAIGMLRCQQHALLHSEVFADFGLADTLRPLLWERLRAVGRNHALARMWTRESSHFWRGLGFDPPNEQQLTGFPASFGPVDAGPLYTLKVREDPFADMTPEQEEVLLKQHLRADTERMLQQARTLRTCAYIVSVVFIILLVVFGRYLWRYRARQSPPPSDVAPGRRF